MATMTKEQGAVAEIGKQCAKLAIACSMNVFAVPDTSVEHSAFVKMRVLLQMASLYSARSLIGGKPIPEDINTGMINCSIEHIFKITLEVVQEYADNCRSLSEQLKKAGKTATICEAEDAIIARLDAFLAYAQPWLEETERDMSAVAKLVEEHKR